MVAVSRGSRPVIDRFAVGSIPADAAPLAILRRPNLPTRAAVLALGAVVAVWYVEAEPAARAVVAPVPFWALRLRRRVNDRLFDGSFRCGPGVRHAEILVMRRIGGGFSQGLRGRHILEHIDEFADLHHRSGSVPRLDRRHDLDLEPVSVEHRARPRQIHGTKSQQACCDNGRDGSGGDDDMHRPDPGRPSAPILRRSAER